MRVVDGVRATNLGLHSEKTHACRPIAVAGLVKSYEGDGRNGHLQRKMIEIIQSYRFMAARKDIQGWHFGWHDSIISRILVGEGYPRLPDSEGNLVLHVSDPIRARECL